VAGQQGDGLVTVGGVFGEQGQKVLAAFKDGARAAGKDPAGMAKVVEIFAVVGDEQTALPGARLWQFCGAIDGLFEVADPREIRRIAEERTTPEAVLQSWIISRDPEVHAAALIALARQGFTHVFVHPPQDDQHAFIEVYGTAVLPAVRRALGTP
jgi:alkanesulfonate monooxygenase SsuD/methylene tetrahydromethanopterin reductase-like flavin-dependent oxidoreductase (luciferase family)